MDEIVKTKEEQIKFKVQEFEKFYNCLMSNAPEGYNPWFFPCDVNGKNPSVKAILRINGDSKGSWHHDAARLSKEQCIEHIKWGYNLGISARGNDPLVIIDIDEEKYLDQIPKNTLINVSRKRAGLHAFCWNKDGSAKINLPTNYGEIRSDNQYVLAPGSYTPFLMSDKKEEEKYNNLPEWAKEDPHLGYYTVKEEVGPREISFEELPDFFKDVKKSNVEKETNILQREEKNTYSKEGKYTELFKLKVSDIVGLAPSNKRVGHPLHESDTDANWSLSEDGSIGHCWRHLVSLNAVQYLCVKNGYIDCQDAGVPHKGRGISKLRGDKKSWQVAYNEAIKLGLIKAKPFKIFTDKKTQQEVFAESQPYFYDRAGIFWLWDGREFRWDMVDDVDLLNMIAGETNADIIKPSERSIIINILKQQGRKNIPEKAEKHWVQFKNLIYDFKKDITFDASPKYFITNPIPWDMADSDDTPTMDKIFTEWVGEENVKLLHEIIAYSLLTDYPIHRIFCFIGDGMNGKSKYLDLLRKFVGTKNCCSTELDTLLASRFEITRLHKKLVCLMGETNFNEMSKTSTLKKLSGGDLIGYEYKNKDLFEEINYAKILIATNNLPATTDKTIGFYRRWCIIDFPNRFSEKKNILEDIPEIEYNALAKKSINILKEILLKREFTNEGTLEERMDKYESKSNFLEKFIKTFTKQELNSWITKADFVKKFGEWCKENRHREMSENTLGMALKKIGIETRRKYFEWLFDGKGGQLRVLSDISWQN